MKIDALAAAGVHFSKNRCFHYFSKLRLQEHAKRQQKWSIFGGVRLTIPFEKRVEISFGFLDDF